MVVHVSVCCDFSFPSLSSISSLGKACMGWGGGGGGGQKRLQLCMFHHHFILFKFSQALKSTWNVYMKTC